MLNYFTLLGIEQTFNIDKAALEKNYFALQQKLHPDRLAGKPEAERTQSLQQSMTANEAYNTLKDPFKRGEYLLLLQGIQVKEGRDSIKPSQEILMAVMEWRERLEEAADIQVIEAEVTEEKNTTLENISGYFTKGDYQNAAQEVIKLRYLEKIQEEVKVKRRAVAPGTIASAAKQSS